MSWILSFGEIPAGLCVLHSCDNPPCVRPDHLFLGTDQINMADRDTKGRQCRGEPHHLARLTEADVIEIRQRLAKGEGRASIARDYDVYWSTIRDIHTRKTWKHLP